jgi:hypothetical protein
LSVRTDAGALFRVGREGPGEILQPLELARSGWYSDHLRGMAVTGALARSAVREAGRSVAAGAFSPARFTVDLFRPARMTPTVVESKVVRTGRRLCLVDSSVVQSGVEVARARTLFLRPGASPGGRVGVGTTIDVPSPPVQPPASEDRRLYHTVETGWTDPDETPDSASRRSTWHHPVALIEGEQVTPFQMTACVADVSNVVSNWGDQGLQFINADVTLSLSRLPRELRLGLSALTRLESEGIAVGTAALFDREGTFGTVGVVGLANAQNAVDPRTKTRR